ncbi:MAG: hypothetical protein AAGA59_01715 [Actinomycetota bacterium]
MTTGRTYDRRTFLLGASAVVVGAACTDGDDGPEPVGGATSGSTTTTTVGTSAAGGGTDLTTDSTTDAEVDALTPAMFDALNVCTLLPSSTSGPFPSPELLDRRAIHDGYPGHPLRLGVRVVDAACEPIPGAVVEIWHTDASGDYSAYEDGGSGKDEGPGTTFCRGAQTADDDGILEFETIYPGWYGGRAVHIHTTVHLDDSPVLTAQLYFDETYTDGVHATGEYARFGPPDTSWADDGLIGDPAVDGTGIALSAAPTVQGDGTLGLVNLGIDPSRS